MKIVPKKSTLDLPNLTDQVLVSIDAEWETTEGDEMSDESTRSYQDVISVQVVIARKGCPTREYMLYRDRDDRPFRFIDLHNLVKDYYRENNLKPRRVNNTNHSRFKSKKGKVPAYDYTIIGFWLGVDISVFEDWRNVLDPKADNLINLKQQAIATKSPLSVSIKTNSHNQGYEYEYAMLTIRDMILLSAAKVNLDAIGKMLHFPKLDTEKWDQEDGKPTGYYKSHMRDLLKQRPEDYERYALTDSEICMQYANEWFSFLDTLQDLSNKDRKKLPFACGSLGAKIAQNIGKKGDRFLAETLMKMLEDNPWTVNSLQFFVKKRRVDGEYIPFCVLEKTDVTAETLLQNLDWNMLRNGYFQAKDISNDPKHRQGVLDYSSKKLIMNAQLGFETANEAFFGGHNVSYTHGKVTRKKVIDIDAKSAYNVGGHLIPDFIASVGWYVYQQPIEFSQLINSISLVNGPFTLGYLEADIDYPDNAWLTLTPYRVKIGDTPVYVKHMRRAKITLTDAFTAYELGARVIVYSVAIPLQDQLTCDEKYMDHVCPTGNAQDTFAKERAKYSKKNPKNALNKMLGNSVYGKTGQGLHEKVKRAYDNYKMYYLPFSSVTNPFVASQYTSITRYVLMRLIRAAKAVEPSLSLQSITTDGFLTTVDPSVDTQEFSRKLTQYLKENEFEAWVYVAREYFDDVFFEIKADTMAELYNIRTRFQLTKDGNVHALAGLKDVSVDTVFDDLENNNISVQTTQKRFSSLTDEKHLKTLKGLLKVDDLFVTQKYNYDFTRKLVKFTPGDDGHGYFDTIPFEDINEYNLYRKYALTLAKNWCITENSAGPLFLRCMLDLLAGKKEVKYHAKNKEKLYQQDDYVYRHLLRYIARYEDGKVPLSKLYDRYFSKIYDNYDSFTRAYRRARSTDVFINFLAINELRKNIKEEKNNENL